MIKLNNSLPQV